MDQKNVFMSREGNEWYERNKSAILGKTLERDPIFKALAYLGCKPTRILEIGCANGWRRWPNWPVIMGRCAMGWIPRPAPYKTLTMVNFRSI